MSLGCGGRDRTTDLQVMSLTSYHCSTPRYNTSFSKGTAKLLLFFDICKFISTKKIMQKVYIYIVYIE